MVKDPSVSTPVDSRPRLLLVIGTLTTVHFQEGMVVVVLQRVWEWLGGFKITA